MNTINKIKNLMKEKNMKNSDLARIIFNIPKDEAVPAKYRVRISDYFNNKANIPNDILKKIARYFNVDLNYLLEDNDKIPLTHYLPIIGEASCGVPNHHFYGECGVEYYPVPSELYREGRYFVRAVGESMLPKINEGDLVLCDENIDVHNGNLVHYTINNDESGIKKAIYKNNQLVMLTPLNPEYTPIAITPDDDIRLAKVIGIMSLKV